VLALQPVCGCFIVQKIALSAEVQKNFPRYNLYFYGEGSVDIVTYVSLYRTQFLVEHTFVQYQSIQMKMRLILQR